MASVRRKAREWAIQMLTAADLNPPESIEEFIAESWGVITSGDAKNGYDEVVAMGEDILKNVREFAEARVRGVLQKLTEIDEVLTPLLENWHLYRLGTVERAVLRMGIWEITWSDVPHTVIINEAIDLANWFSSPKSRRIVNAVLDKYAKHLENAQKAAKKASEDPGDDEKQS